MAALADRRRIKIHILGTVIAVRGLAYGIVFVASIGFAVVVLHGDRVLDMVERFAAWIASIATREQPEPDPAAEAQKKPPAEVASPPAAVAPRAAYRASPERLDGRPLPLRVAPDPDSGCKLLIPSGATGILATGQTAYYNEPVLLLFSRKVLWREVTYRGERGWVADYFIEPWGTHADYTAALRSLPPEGTGPKGAHAC